MLHGGLDSVILVFTVLAFAIEASWHQSTR